MFQRTKICSGLLLAFGSIAVFAQDAETQVQRVEVTGSSIKRVDAETALPVQTVTREQIETLGVTTTEELLSSISANSQVGGTTTAQGSGSSTYGEATVSLRGLGANKTLVLVNGHRLANYATDGTAVDINSIPLAQVERVDILKDGASGVYGSDAIAGVVNFILRKNFKGVETTAYFGRPTEKGGGRSAKGSLFVGFGDIDTDHVNLNASLDIAHDQAIYGYQRSYANRAWDNGGAFDVSATPSGNLSTYLPSTTAGVLTGLGTGLGNPLSPSSCATNGSGYDANLGTCRFNSSPYVPLLPDVTRVNGAANFRARIDESSEFYIEGFLSNTKTVVREQPSPYSNSFLATDTLFATKGIYPSIVINPSSPYYPAAYLAAYDAANGTSINGTAVSVSYRAFDGGERVHTDNSTLFHLTTGLTGNIKGFDYEASYSHNASTVKESTQSGYQSQTALVSLLSGNNAFDPFVQYQSSALAAEIAATNYVGPMISSTLATDSVDATLSHDLFTLPGGAVVGSVGVSFRKEQLNLQPSAAYESGDISGYGGNVAPLERSRNEHSVFVEAVAPILKSLEADISVRNDHYPNASSTNPKISLSFTPVQQIKLRGSYGKGFREPSLPELYDEQTLATTNTFKDPVSGDTTQYTQTVGGNPDLAPEKSKQFTLGLVLEPIKNLSATIDYYHIRVKNLVTVLDPEFIVDQAAAGNSEYTDLVTRDSSGNITNIISTNINAGSVMTSGVDIDVQWKSAKSAIGQFGVELNGTWMSKYDETLPDGTVQPSIGHTVDGSGNALNAVSLGGILFRWKHNLQGSYSYGPYGLVVTQNFQSGYYDAARADSSTGTDAVHHGSFETWDLQGSYSGFKNLTLRLGVKNIVDRKPPEAITLGQYFQVGYDPSYYDPHGRFVYGQATYHF